MIVAVLVLKFIVESGVPFSTQFMSSSVQPTMLDSVTVIAFPVPKLVIGTLCLTSIPGPALSSISPKLIGPKFADAEKLNVVNAPLDASGGAVNTSLTISTTPEGTTAVL